MNGRLVDTDVVSFLFKNHPLASLYDPDLRGRTLAVSFMTVAELDRWALQSGWGEQRRQRLARYIEPYIVLPYNRELCRLWAEVTMAGQIAGRRIECADAWIAATALYYGLPLVTHNHGDYYDIPGLEVISHAPHRHKP